MKIIETERLILRTFEDKDIDPMTAIDQDRKVCEYLPGIGNRVATEAGIQRIIKHYEEHGFSLYAVELKATHEFIGFLGLMIPLFDAHFTPAIEIGWRLASHHWGHGFATEGAKAVLNYAFNQLGLKEIVSFTVPENMRSIRVMEKIGMKRDLSGDFHHPKLPLDHPLSLHVLYRIKNYQITFKKMNENDLNHLHQWFQKPHIFKWYAKNKIYTLEMIREKYLPRINDISIPNFIIYDHDKPVGYIQFYSMANHRPEGIINDNHPLFNKFKLNELVGIDLFIADENYLRKGFSSRALRLFIDTYLKEKYKAALVDPLKQNTTAISFFEKNGFRHILSQNDNFDLMINEAI